MATFTEAKKGLDRVTDDIINARETYERARRHLVAAFQILDQIPNKYEDVSTTINGYTPDNDAEAQLKADLAELTSEFVALRTQINNDLTALGIDPNA